MVLGGSVGKHEKPQLFSLVPFLCSVGMVSSINGLWRKARKGTRQEGCRDGLSKSPGVDGGKGGKHRGDVVMCGKE
jgi:hypothetical protein